MTAGRNGGTMILDALGQAWRGWAELGKSLPDARWDTPTRLDGWNVRHVYAHYADAPATLAAVIRSETASAAPSFPDAASLLRHLQQPGGIAETGADSIRDAFDGFSSTFAYNFKVAFHPYPIPPMGKIASGVMTLAEYKVESAERIQLPIPFKWPVSMLNLKRCLNVNRIPVEGGDKHLVLINLHLEAYDDGEGKIMQTAALKEFLEKEYAEGNYVIAGGDFNQIFSSEDADLFKAQEGKWAPGVIDVSTFEDGWQFLMDERTPSCRSLDQPLIGADLDNFQYYLIDGFIVSENVKVSNLETKDLGFINSDHNPVVMEFTLD